MASASFPMHMQERVVVGLSLAWLGRGSGRIGGWKSPNVNMVERKNMLSRLPVL